MKYEVGDIVKIRDDLIPNEKYGGLTLFCHMSEHLTGNTFEIESIDQEHYRVGSFWISEEMIERKL